MQLPREAFGVGDACLPRQVAYITALEGRKQSVRTEGSMPAAGAQTVLDIETGTDLVERSTQRQDSPCDDPGRLRQWRGRTAGAWQPSASTWQHVAFDEQRVGGWAGGL